MSHDKKYGFEEVDKISSKEVKLKPIHLLYIISFSLLYLYISIHVIDTTNNIDYNYLVLWMLCIYGLVLIFIINGFDKQLVKTAKSKKYAELMNEKCLLEEKFQKILSTNPITLENYIRAFLSVYSNDYTLIQSRLEFKRLMYLRKVISYKQFNNSMEELCSLIEEKDRLNKKFQKIINLNPATPTDYVRIFFRIYGIDYPNHLNAFKRLLYLHGKLTISNEKETQKLITAIENRHASMFLDITFEKMLSDYSSTSKDYVDKFMSVYRSNYPENLHIFKGMIYSKRKINPDVIENEIESYLKLLLLNKYSYKSIYGHNPIYDFKLIHDFSKTYGNSYKEEDLENLNKLLITKEIKIHDINILKKLISKATLEYSYSMFTECMKTETPLDEIGYVKTTIKLFGNNLDYQLPFLHRFLMERNLTSLEYNNFEEHIKTKIFELNLVSGKKQLSVHNVDVMNGYKFEAFVGQLYEKMGYSVEQTPLSNDQGADLIISKYGERTAVQVKNYTSNVPNSAVQQVVAAKNYYGCSSCSVVTNSYFTKSAIELADANGVKLVNRDELNYLINQYN